MPSRLRPRLRPPTLSTQNISPPVQTQARSYHTLTSTQLPLADTQAATVGALLWQLFLFVLRQRQLPRQPVSLLADIHHHILHVDPIAFHP